MPVTDLDHKFVQANDLERSRRFYCDVLGFETMPRPDLPFPGYWLGVDGEVQVNMGQNGILDSERYYVGSAPASATDNSAVVDHIAFLATEPERFAKRFDTIGLAARKRYFPEFKPFQMFVRDPDGLTIELNLPGLVAEPAWGAGAESYARMPHAAKTEPSIEPEDQPFQARRSKPRSAVTIWSRRP
jgi:catechol 2,3-dioxygenase-like lactoylglutathione lyase family enzyme